MRLFSYMAFDRMLQLGTSFGALLLAGSAMPAEDFTRWSATVGLFASLSAFLYAFPAEPLVRSLLRRPSPLHAARLLLISLLARGAWSLALCLGVWAWWQMVPGTPMFSRGALLVLLACAALAETLAFAVTLTLRAAGLHVLLRARMWGTVGKIAGIALAVAWSAPLIWLAIAFSLDAIVIVFVCWRQDLRRRPSFVRQAAGLASRVSAWSLGALAVRAFRRALFSTMLVMTYNALLRSDRLLLSQSSDPQALSAQSVCMQFIDPAVMFLSGYINNRFVQGGGVPRLQAMQWLWALFACGAVASVLGPWMLGWLPSNLAEVGPRFAQAAWLLPAYGTLSLVFYALYYRCGDRAAASALLIFALVQAVLPGVAGLLPNLVAQPYLALCLLTLGACSLILILTPVFPSRAGGTT